MQAPRSLTLGLEIEAVAPGNAVQRGSVQTRIADILERHGIRAKVVRHGHTRGETAWLVTSDETIEPGPGAVGVELISPILEDNDWNMGAWKQEVVRVLEAVQNEIRLMTNETTGLHVHVGVGKGVNEVFSLTELKRIAIVVALYEVSIDRLHEPHRSADPDHRNKLLLSVRENVFLGAVDDAKLASTILSAESTEQFLGMVNPAVPRPRTQSQRGQQPRRESYQYDKRGVPTQISRLHKVNFTSIHKHGTVEFRQHAGSIDPYVICAWADLVLGLVRRALSFTEDELNSLDVAKSPMVPTIISRESILLRELLITACKP